MKLYWLFRLLGFLGSTLPIKFCYRAAALVGDVIYFGWRRPSRNAVANMRHVLNSVDTPVQGIYARMVRFRSTKKRAELLARRSLRNYAKTLVDIARFDKLSIAQVNELCAPEGTDHLRRALAKGKGLIVVTYHFGSWDFAAVEVMRQLPDLDFYALADTLEPPRLDDLVNGARARKGIKIIRLNSGAMRQIFEALRRQQVVFIAMDKPTPGDGVPVNLFGGRAWLPSGPAAISLRTGAPIITGYAVRKRGDTHYRAVAEPHIEYTPIGDKDEDVKALTQLLASRMERAIAQYPDQWYMFREMWPQDSGSGADAEEDAEEMESQPQLAVDGSQVQ